MNPPNTGVDIDAIMAQDLETINGALYPASSLTVASKALFENDDGPVETICRNKVEGRIDELQREVRALKSCLNATTITGRLPPEILARIFSELISSASLSGFSPARFSWIRLTHVCRRWRAVALSFPALWSSITTAHTVWVQLMLCRSKEAPLSVNLDFRAGYSRHDGFKALLSKTFQHGNRLRSLTLFVKEADMLADFPVAIPRLQQLSLASGPRYAGVTRLPTHILSDPAPELLRLEVVGFSIPWKTLPSAPKLTFLKLLQDPSGDKLSHADLAESIGRMPQLQDVEISGFLPSGPTISVTGDLHFPVIQSLSLKDTFPAVLNFLRSCAPFRAQTIELVVSDEITTAGAVGPFFATLAGLWKDTVADNHKAQLGMQALHLKGLGVFNPNLVFEVHYRQYDPNVNPKPDLRISLPVPAAMIPQVVSSFAETFNASSTRWLTIALDHDTALGGLWESTFSRWSALETLHLLGERPVFTFVSAMKEKWAQSILKKTSKPSRSNKRPFFPLLSTMIYRAVDFAALGFDVLSLARLLRRFKRVHPVRELHLDCCRNFTSDDYDIIEEKASGLTVIWDGDEDIDDSEDEDEDEEDFYDYFGYDYDSDFYSF